MCINKRPRDPDVLLRHLPNWTKLHLYVCLPKPEAQFFLRYRNLLDDFQTVTTDDGRPYHSISSADTVKQRIKS